MSTPLPMLTGAAPVAVATAAEAITTTVVSADAPLSLFGLMLGAQNNRDAHGYLRAEGKADAHADPDHPPTTDKPADGLAVALLALPVIPVLPETAAPAAVEARDPTAVAAAVIGALIEARTGTKPAKQAAPTPADTDTPTALAGQHADDTGADAPIEPKLPVMLPIPPFDEPPRRLDTRLPALAAEVVDAAQAALPQLPLTTAPQTTTPAPEITVPPSHPQWAEQVAASVVWTVRQKLTEAELRLHPPELGPVRVHLKIDLSGDVGVQFVATQPEARQALEDSMPRLRELFQQQGITLANAQVSDREHAPQPFTPGGSAAPGAGDAPAAEEPRAVAVLRRLGLLDEYA